MNSDGNQTLAGTTRIRRRIRLAGPPAVVRIPKRAQDGVGACQSRNYCACGAKKTNGTCPRCSA